MHPNPKFPTLQQLHTEVSLSVFYDCLEMIEVEEQLLEIKRSTGKQ